MTTQKEPTQRIEEYLESMVNMVAEGKPVLAARLAERLGVAPATVSATLQRMVRDGLIAINREKEISLTRRGNNAALTVLKRHRLAERLLVDILGVEWHEVHEEACLLEHAISPRVEERLEIVLKQPSECPHGNPIPSNSKLPPARGVSLNSMSQGSKVTIARITEEATRDRRLMEHLHSLGVVPGATFTVKQVAPYAGTIVLASDGQEVTLSMATGAMIWVTPESSASR
ncbi:MAG: metal-dependent transcriptional regulator [Chloroflexi bacterium]|nr:metal-dependent transcriptional regulator [Chloroflexota bacterium]